MPPEEVLTADLPIRPIELPTPFGVGTVNVHLVGRPPLTLVDAGPHYPPALAALEEALASSGHRWTDIGRVVLTHHHVDHVGLAAAVRQRSGAEIVAHRSLADVLPNLVEAMALDELHAERLMLAHGLAAARVRIARHAMAGHRRYARPVPVDRLVDGGDVVGELDVEHRPGHSSSDIVLRSETRGVAFVGDHLLARISSNALVHRPVAGDSEASTWQTLLTYRRSLERSLLDLPGVAHAGHGPRIDEPAVLIGARLIQQDRRTDAIYHAIRNGTRSIGGLIDALWPGLDPSQLFLAFSEVAGHLGRLVEQKRVAVVEPTRLIACR